MSKKIKIINCGFGNLASVSNAIDYLGYDFQIIDKPCALKDATHVILPGVGAFQSAMSKLKNDNWIDVIDKFIKKKGYFLGICLGMQLLFKYGTDESTYDLIDGLGFFDGKCEKFNFQNINGFYPLPHIGFNKVKNIKTKIWNNIEEETFFYFVHSFRIKEVKDKMKNYKVCYTDYGERFISFIEKDNIFGAQFHPEKSHTSGLKLIKNFCDL